MAYYEGEIGSLGCSNNNDGGMFGGGWGGLIGLIAVAALFGLNGNGGGLFGNRGNGGNEMFGYQVGGLATQADVASGFNNSAVLSSLNDLKLGQQTGFAAVQQTLCQGFGGINTSLVQQGYETRNAINGVSAQLASCCCELSRGQERLACDIERSTNAIVQSGNANTQRILDFLCNEKISALQSENAALTAQLSQNAQTQTIINQLMPVARPAYITCSPYESAFGYGRGSYGNNCGCGCGCGCNG